MSDWYRDFANSGVGTTITTQLGLPRPAVLRRYEPGEPLLPGPAVLASAGAGGLHEQLAGLLRDAPAAGREDWLHVTLTDRDRVWDAMARLREVYPNVLELAFARDAAIAAADGPVGRAKGGEPLDLLGSFYAEMKGEALPELARPVAIAAIFRPLAAVGVSSLAHPTTLAMCIGGNRYC